MTGRQVVYALMPTLLLVPVLFMGVQLLGLVRTERALARAARAGSLEATLPRATRLSVEAAVRRSLERDGIEPRRSSVSLSRNDCALLGVLLPPPAPGDRLTLLVSLPALAATRDYLAPLGFSLSARRLLASATRCQP